MLSPFQTTQILFEVIAVVPRVQNLVSEMDFVSYAMTKAPRLWLNATVCETDRQTDGRTVGHAAHAYVVHT